MGTGWMDIDYTICTSQDNYSVFTSLHQEDPNWGFTINYKVELERRVTSSVWETIHAVTQYGSIYATGDSHRQFDNIAEAGAEMRVVYTDTDTGDVYVSYYFYR